MHIRTRFDPFLHPTQKSPPSALRATAANRSLLTGVTARAVLGRFGRLLCKGHRRGGGWLPLRKYNGVWKNSRGVVLVMVAPVVAVMVAVVRMMSLIAVVAVVPMMARLMMGCVVGMVSSEVGGGSVVVRHGVRRVDRKLAR
ncbi:hypothetical protein BU16DRAFT_163492 [Lophium mytilinum]|uniref:Uncharacterized protein n=1 Tax=Lophium mytilinum TaxID=390894 RepID=A0A6A6QB76_9PEZI|nr:hypothetical protein BU16DRAFT_163492 [Lophium mytilinum]